MVNINSINEFIGKVSIGLAIMGIFIVIFEQLGFIKLYVGITLSHLSIMDTWLIIIIVVFGIPITLLVIIFSIE